MRMLCFLFLYHFRSTCLYKPVHNNENEILVTLLKPFTASVNSAVHSDTTRISNTIVYMVE